VRRWFDPKHWNRVAKSKDRARQGHSAHIKVTPEVRTAANYRRGGSRHTFRATILLQGEDDTRPFRKWQLTYSCIVRACRVPAPSRALSTRRMTYTGDIITERLNTGRFARRMPGAGRALILTWIEMGRCIRRSTTWRVPCGSHSHNLLLNEDAKVYMRSTSDQCKLRRAGLWRDAIWCACAGSLGKVTYALPRDRFGEADWHGLLDGYRQTSGEQAPGAWNLRRQPSGVRYLYILAFISLRR